MSASSRCSRRSHAAHVVFAAHAGSVALQGTLFSGGVRSLENPVLPGTEASEYPGFHRLSSCKPEICLHARHRVRGEARPFLQEEANFVIPVDLVESEGDEPHLVGLMGEEGRPAPRFGRFDPFRRAKKTGLKPGQIVRHWIRAEI